VRKPVLAAKRRVGFSPPDKLTPRPLTEESGSFLKKRTKKLLIVGTCAGLGAVLNS
jgi:hypothetical protein